MPERTQGELHKGWALTLLVTVQFMLILDASIVNVALPSIQRRFDIATQSTLSWVGDGYILTFGGLLLLGGRLGDRFGRRRLFFAGTALFGIASFGTGIAPSFGFLVAARFVQGAGAAMVAPAALGLLMVIFKEGSERNKALGVWGAVSGSGGAAGLIIGGLLITELSWRWVFWINVPIVAGALLATPRLLPETSGENSVGSFDLPGASAVVLGITSLVYGFVEAGNKSWGSPNSYLFIAAGAALLGVFVVIEQHTAHPLVRFSIFRSRSVSGANLAMMIFYMAAIGVWFYLALYLQEVDHYSALRAGIAVLPLNGTLAVTATLSSKWISRFGPKPVSALGALFLAAGLYWFHFLNATGSYVSVVLGPLFLMGFGIGLVMVGLTVGAVSGVDHKDAGLASGIFNTVSEVGAAIGLAVLTTFSTTKTTHELRQGASTVVALSSGFSNAVLVAAGASAVSLVVILLVLSNRGNRAFVEMVRSRGAELQEVADAVAESETVAGFGGPEFESEVTALHTSAGEQMTSNASLPNRDGESVKVV
jgi:EmrB/QacA subfamily drug resistance transporter